MHVHLALAQFMAGEVRAAERSLARAGAIAGSIDFPQGPWSAAYASWLGSWMWIEAGRLDRADQAISPTALVQRQARIRHVGADRRGQTAALEGITALRSETDGLSDHAEAIEATSSCGEALGCGCSCPSTSRRSARCAAEGDEEGARRDYAVCAGARRPDRHVASTTPRPDGASPTWRVTVRR